MAGGVQANWHVGDLDLGDLTEVAGAEVARLRPEANVIDLTKSEAELAEELAELTRREGQYAARSQDEYGRPLECALKWQPHHRLMDPRGGSLSCFNCPHFTASKQEARSLLCALGRAQEEVIEATHGAQLASSLDEELAAAYGRDIDACVELAEALA